jgi:hypothetical protein
MSGGWSAFWKGFCNTFGIAPVRRYVEPPEESLEAARADLRAAIAAAAQRYSDGNPDFAEFEIPAPPTKKGESGD